MEEWQREHLRRSREKIVKSMTDVDKIVTVLGSRGLLTDDMEDTILVEGTKHGKIRELMKIIPRRGEQAFDIFYEVLVSEGEGPCADIIKPELKNRRFAGQNDQFYPSAGACYTSTEIKDLPDVFPDPDDDPKIINVKTCTRASGNFMFECFRKVSREIYSLKKQIRGLCVVINNENFSMAPGFEDRTGTQQDLDALKTLFHELHFKVETCDNRKALEMKAIIQHYKGFNHSNFDCFVFIILSHGANGSVYGVDGNKVEISEILNNFDGMNCNTLEGKPKLFFIQACRGEKKDKGIVVEDKTEVIEITKTLKNLNLGEQRETTDSETSNIAVKADMYIAMATMPGYVSWRNTDIGTWFIQAIVYVFKNYSHQCNFNNLMTKVNASVQSAETKEGRNKQTSVSTSSLNKELYFFPGLVEPGLVEQTYRMNQAQPSDAPMQY